MTTVCRRIVCRVVWGIVVVVVIYGLGWRWREIVCLRKILWIVDAWRSRAVTSSGIGRIFLTYKCSEMGLFFQARCVLTLSFFFSLLFLSPFRSLVSSYTSYTSDCSSFCCFACATLASAST